jgi:hypothetical protein
VQKFGFKCLKIVEGWGSALHPDGGACDTTFSRYPCRFGPREMGFQRKRRGVGGEGALPFFSTDFSALWLITRRMHCIYTCHKFLHFSHLAVPIPIFSRYIRLVFLHCTLDDEKLFSSVSFRIKHIANICIKSLRYVNRTVGPNSFIC